MNPNQQLHAAGQSLWLDSITRDLVRSGTLERYIDELAVTGLTSNPSIFDKAVSGSDDYDEQIAELLEQGKSGEELFFELAITDLRAAADLFAPTHSRSDGVDGWVSLEVSPLLAHDAASTISEAASLHEEADRDNLFIKIPGTTEGAKAIEETIAAGVPVNVTLLFSAGHYQTQAEAYLRGVERRIEQGVDPAVGSVASIFISRWDVAVADKVPDELTDRLGIAAATQAYAAYRNLYESDRWLRLESEGARRQRLLFASTSTKDPELADTTYVSALAAPDTVNTMPEKTLLAFAEHGEVGEMLPADGGEIEELLGRFAEAGIDFDQLAAQLQDEGAEKFDESWKDLLTCIETKSAQLEAAG
jgi:transaldolase